MAVYLSPGMYTIQFWNWETNQWQDSGHWHLSDFSAKEQDQLKRCQRVRKGKLQFRLVEETVPSQRFELLKDI